MEYNETPILFDGPLALGGDGDWFTIEKDPEHHNNTHSLQRIDAGCMAMVYSGRISDADVEGDREQMIALATAIIDGQEYSAKRCSVSKPKDGRVEFESPRNSMRPASVLEEHARKLAIDIITRLSK